MPPKACAASSTALPRLRIRTTRPDQGTTIKVKITRRQATSARRRSISPAPRRSRTTNFNAPEPVTRAAVLYVFRVMVDDDIPMNAGCLRPINIIIPEGSMLTPDYPAAVVAGNVETSPARHQLPVRRARRARRRAGHDEQPHLRQRALPVLRDDLLRRARPRPGLQRHRRRPHPHDQLAPDRPGDPGIPLPVLLEDFHIREGSGGKGDGMPATASAAPSASSRRWIARSCPATAASARSAWPAARPARSARTRCAATTAAWRSCKGCDPTVLDAGEAVIVQTPTAGGYGKPK